ncbi:MAG: hypothetical protein V1646_01210 [bacterium]
MKKVIKSLFFSIFLGLFAFASTNLWGATQKPVCSVEAAQVTDDAQVRQELAELMHILELRADAIFYAINESIDRNSITTQIADFSSANSAAHYAKRDTAKRLTRTAMNIASTAYLLASENVKSHLDKLEIKAKTKGIFTYSDIENIIATDVLKSEKIHSKDFSEQSLNFQFQAIAETLSIKDKCQNIAFLEYITLIQKMYTITSDFLKTKSHILFLEELNIPSNNIALICKGLFSAHLRNIIDLAFRAEVMVQSAPVKYTSAKIEAHKKKILADIVQERKVICSRLLTLDEIKEIISQQLVTLPEKLRLRILALTNPENSASLIHYIQIWGEQLIRPISKDDHMQYFSILNSELESFKKIFSGIDLKSESTGADPKNIWPNLVAKLETLNFSNLIRPQSSSERCSSEPGCSKAADGSKGHKGLTQAEEKAEQLAKDLIAEEEAKKKKRETAKQKTAAKQAAERSKSAAKRKEETPSVTITPKLGSSKQKQKHKEQDAPSVVESLRQANRELLPPLPSTSSPAPAAPTVKIEVTAADLTAQVQDPEIEEACKLVASESQSGQSIFEPENPKDKISTKYNCILDLSRGETGYQCKIFLHPEAAGTSINFLANLDYSSLPKYKNPRDNNHAFSNLVEKHFGYLGVITSQKSTGNGWIVIRISFPGRITWIGHAMEDACQLPPSGTFEFVIMKKDMNPESYARCVHRFFRPN